MCWGDNYASKASPPNENFTSISNGTNHTCALRAVDGAAICWGSNIDIYEYDSEYKGQASPPYGERFIAISSGEEHTCALRHDGAAVC